MYELRARSRAACGRRPQRPRLYRTLAVGASNTVLLVSRGGTCIFFYVYKVFITLEHGKDTY